MFTGIIQELGTIQKIEKLEGLTRLTIHAPKILSTSSKKIGDSIAVDGACLTVTSLTTETFTAEAIPESLKKTIIGNYTEGTKINLESPVKIGDTLDGHMVQGHVDFTSTVKSSQKDGDSLIIGINFPIEQSRYFALKGSVTINGTSLTISYLGNDYFEVSLIPETINNTNLSLLKEGSPVNIEIDLIARYLDRLLEGKEKEIKYSFLKQRNFI